MPTEATASSSVLIDDLIETVGSLGRMVEIEPGDSPVLVTLRRRLRSQWAETPLDIDRSILHEEDPDLVAQLRTTKHELSELFTTHLGTNNAAPTKKRCKPSTARSNSWPLTLLQCQRRASA